MAAVLSSAQSSSLLLFLIIDLWIVCFFCFFVWGGWLFFAILVSVVRCVVCLVGNGSLGSAIGLLRIVIGGVMRDERGSTRYIHLDRTCNDGEQAKVDRTETKREDELGIDTAPRRTDSTNTHTTDTNTPLMLALCAPRPHIARCLYFFFICLYFCECEGRPMTGGLSVSCIARNAFAPQLTTNRRSEIWPLFV